MERCRHCGKDITQMYKEPEWAHYVNGVVYKYCDRGTYITTRKQKDRIAEPFTKQDIINAILNEL